MSKGNIKSYPPLQPTESKKYAILISGERVWVIAYQEYLELQIKNLRMGKPSFSFLHAVLLKKKSQIYEQFLFLKKLLLKLNHMIEGITKDLFKKIFSGVQPIFTVVCFFFFQILFFGESCSSVPHRILLHASSICLRQKQMALRYL